MPVTQKGEFFCAVTLVRIEEITVQTDASIIKTSPNETLIFPPPMFIAIIPVNPTIAPITLQKLNFSSFIKRNAKMKEQSQYLLLSGEEIM